MNPVEVISSVFGNYANFSGRAPRSEFWWFQLFSSVLLGILFLLMNSGAILWPILAFIVALAMFLPTLAVWVRRLHDTNRSAWWLLLSLVPWVGGLVLLIMLAFPGTPGPNRYGPEPRPFLPPTTSAGKYPESPYGLGGPDSPPEPGPSGRQFCARCGTQLQPEARFCNACGASVQTEPQVSMSKEVASDEADSHGNKNGRPQPANESQSYFKLIAGLVVALLVSMPLAYLVAWQLVHEELFYRWGDSPVLIAFAILMAGLLVALVVGAIIARTFVEPAGGDANAEKGTIDEK